MAASESCSSSSEETSGNMNILLTDVFEVNRKRQRVTLSTTSITWQAELQPKSVECLLLEEVVAVCPAELTEQGCHSVFTSRLNKSIFNNSPPQLLNVDGFQVFFINRLWKHRWKLENIIFAHSDYNTLNQWTNCINNIIKSFSQRPQRLMVFINPFGGKKQALQIFERKVQPLFNLARIDAHVIITQRANHAKDLLMEMPLNKVDGIIGVGGDGTFNELLNGLVLRTQKEVGIDANDQNATLIQPKLRIGIIPGGSTDAMAFVTSGTNDAVTAALHIILGDSIGVDVSTVYNNNRLLLCCTTMLAYGYFGDILKASEKYRWMGPYRYDWSGFKQLLKLKSYKGEITYNCVPKPQASPVDGRRCVTGCGVCASAFQHLDCNKDNETGWETVSGKFVGVNTATTSCSCLRTTKGISPNAHIGDGYTDLILVSKCSKLNYLRYLISVATPCLSPFNLDFVKVHRVREFHFKSIYRRSICIQEEELVDRESAQVSNQQLQQDSATGNSSVWNCDGEILVEPIVAVKVHCQLINLFARGIEDLTGGFNYQL